MYLCEPLSYYWSLFSYYKMNLIQICLNICLKYDSSIGHIIHSTLLWVGIKIFPSHLSDVTFRFHNDG